MLRKSRKALALAALLSAGTLFQTGLVPTGCGAFLAESALVNFNFCSVFNCTSGTFFNFCEPVPLFIDCPNLVPDAGMP